jgi:ribonuclease VapC
MLAESGHERLIELIDSAVAVSVGAPTVVESAIILSARVGRDMRGTLDQFLREAEVAVIPFGAEHSDAALAAFLRFGKGRHPAGLNFGDCLSYAMAAVSGQPLLCVGNDFPRTDLQLA